MGAEVDGRMEGGEEEEDDDDDDEVVVEEEEEAEEALQTRIPFVDLAQVRDRQPYP